MGIPVLNHLDFRSVSELRNAILHKTTDSSASNVEGKIIYDTGANKIKFYDGSAWQTLGTSDATGDIEGVVAGTGLSGGATSGTATLNIDISEFSAVTPTSGDSFLTLDSDGSTEQLTTVSALQTYMQNNLTFTTNTNTQNVFTSSFVDSSNDIILRLTKSGASSGTQDIKFVAGSNITLNHTDANNIEIVGTNTNTQLSQEQVEDFVGGMLDGTETGITVGYDDTNGNIDFVVADTTVAGDSGSTGMTPGDTLTIAGGTNVTTAMSGDTLTITSSDTNTQLSSEQVQDIVGAMFSSNTETRISATYQDADGTIDLVVDDMTANTDVDVSIANLKTRLAGGFGSNAVTIGDSSDVVTIGNDLIVTGDLTVSGDTVTANVGTLDVEDKNITINKSSGDSSSTADGAGLTIQDAVDASNDATLLWNASSDKFVFSHLIEAPGTSIFTNLDISGNVDVDGTLEADAYTVNGTALLEFVQDTVGAMFSSNTETRISASYQDGDGTIDLVVDDMTANDNTQLSTEQVQDIVGGMFSGNTETNITATYQDGDGTIDLVSTNTQLSLASAAEVQTGTNATKAVTPDTLAAKSVHATIDVSDSNFTSNLYAEITHNLGTEDVFVQAFDSSTKASVVVGAARTDKSDSASTSKVKISFSHAPTNDIEVIITSIKGSTAGSVAYN